MCLFFNSAAEEKCSFPRRKDRSIRRRSSREIVIFLPFFPPSRRLSRFSSLLITASSAVDKRTGARGRGANASPRICIIERLMSFCSRCFSERRFSSPFVREQLPGYVKKNVSGVIRQVANRRCAHPSPISQLPTEFSRRLLSFSRRRRFVAISHLGDGPRVSPRIALRIIHSRALVVVGAWFARDTQATTRVGLRSVRLFYRLVDSSFFCASSSSLSPLRSPLLRF